MDSSRRTEVVSANRLALLTGLAGLLLSAYFPVPESSRRHLQSQNSGSQYSNTIIDPDSASISESYGARILRVRLTPQYTILDIRFTNKGKPYYSADGRYMSIRAIWVSPQSKLSAANGTRTFAFVKAEGIPVLPKKLTVEPIDQVSFSVYFQRLDPGLETFDWGEHTDSEEEFYWQFRNLRVNNPKGAESTSDSTKTATATNKPTLSAKPLQTGDKVALNALYFEPSKATLLPVSFAELDQVAGLLQSRPQMTIRIEGYTDVVGDHSKNLQLSQERAQACRSYLVRKGIAAERIQAIGYGDRQPLRTTGTEKERSINRRVEFVILTL